MTTHRPGLRVRPGPSHVLAIGTSAGGFKALVALLGELPAGFPIPIVVVQHLSPTYRSRLTELIQRYSALDVHSAAEGDQIRAGHVYIAPPDHHLVVDAAGRLHLTQEPLVHFSRPSVDVLFESVAEAFGLRAIALVLTGGGFDGSKGGLAVKEAGGLLIAQDRASSLNFGMPGAAIATGAVDHILPLDEIAPFLLSLVAAAPAAPSPKESN